MGDITASVAYESLVSWLKSVRGLEWVAEQVEDEISLGAFERVSVNEYSASTELFGDQVSPRRQKKADFLARKDYLPDEKLKIVIDALETTIIGGIEMQRELMRVINVRNLMPAIKFVPGETGEIQTEVAHELSDGPDSLTLLKKLLRDLQEDVESAD